MTYLKRLNIQLARILLALTPALFLYFAANTTSPFQKITANQKASSDSYKIKPEQSINDPIRLVTIRAGRHEAYGSVVFQFSKRYRYTIPRIKNREIRFTLMNTATRLKQRRKYDSFDSWVQLDPIKTGIGVSIGLPDGFIKHVVIPLSNPYRLVINLYFDPSGVRKPQKKPSSPPKTSLPTVGEKPVAEPPGSQTVSDAVMRKIDLFSARIYSRKGLYGKSINLYEVLRKRYPDDEEIWGEYIETLVEFSQYEQAISEIEKLKKTFPDTLIGQRIQARIYQELNQHRWTFPIYESIIKQNRTDVGIWTDYAYSRQDVGYWSDALNYFSRVLELDPENRSALKGVHEILREHRPNLRAGYSLNVQEAGDARTQTIPIQYRRHLTNQSTIDLNYNRIEIDRSADIAIDAIDQTVNDAYLVLHHQLNPKLEGSIGIGGYDGLGDGASFFVKTGYSPWVNAFVRAAYAWNRPWYDPVDAANFNGAFNRLSASFDWSFDQKWGIFLSGEQWDYFIDNDIDYGRKREFFGIITNRLWLKPELALSYAFYYSHFNYEDEIFRPIDIIPTEAVHSLSGRFEHWPCRYWAVSFSGGWRWDVERSVNSWYILPGLKVRLGNRIETDISYEFSTDAGTAAGGKSETLRFSGKIIF